MPGSKSTQNSSARNEVKLPECDCILEWMLKELLILLQEHGLGISVHLPPG